MFNSEGSVEYARVVAKTWVDPQFREKLIDDPRAALGEQGIHVPDDVAVSVHPGAAQSRLELALPDKPDLVEEFLGRRAAAAASKPCKSDEEKESLCKPTSQTRGDQDDADEQVRDSHGRCVGGDDDASDSKKPD
jgi:hypothetical protein